MFTQGLTPNVSFPAQVELAALEFDAAVQDLEVRVLDHSGKAVTDPLTCQILSDRLWVHSNTRYVHFDGVILMHS